MTEQLVSMLLGTVMITALYGFFRGQLFQLVSQENKTATLEDARGALDIIVRDLRNAGSWGSGSVPLETGGHDDPDSDADAVCNRVYAATKSRVHVQMDFNGNGTCADTDPRENIVYELTGPTATCPGTHIIRRNGDCLVANVTTVPSGRLFSFFDSAGTDLGETPAPAAVRRIRIAFGVETKNPDPQGGGKLSSILSTSVDLRN
ncbi:MAG TPA: hypothetical protein VFM35_01360 [Candidatus Binatia bacterium]|nr:hypothetical protein [Candidatus Binatia bacterium]